MQNFLTVRNFRCQIVTARATGAVKMGKHTGESQIRKRRNSRFQKRITKRGWKPKPNAEARTIVQWLRDCGASNPVIEEATGLTHDFVNRWAAREDTDIAPGRGPDPIIDGEARDKLVKAVVKVRFASAERCRSMVTNPKTGKKVAAATIKKALRDAGLHSAKVRKGQILTGAQKAKRLAWCEIMARKSANFKDWIFSDEKWWCVGGVQGNERMWVFDEDPYPDELFVPTVSHPIKVHIWAAITYDGRSSIHIHDEKVNGETYCACLDAAMLPTLYESDYMALSKRKKYVFMQDGASCHTSKSTYAWLQQNLPKHIKHHKKGEWPASSPDLNPIERLWSILQDRVIAERAYELKSLIKVVKKVWWELEQRTIRNLYDSMPVRIQKCINNDGGRFKV